MKQVDPLEYAFGCYTIRADDRVLRYRGAIVSLAPKVADTLVALLDAGECIVSKAELIERVWPDAFVDEANLTQNVYVLRKTFAAHRSGVRIENVPKRGYRLVVPAVAASLDVHSEPATVPRPPAMRFAAGLAFACTVLLAGAFDAHRAGAPKSPYGLPPEGIREYVLGRYYLESGTARDLQRAADAFGALARDYPASAAGDAGLAETDTSLSFRADSIAERASLVARAVALAGSAVAKDPHSADAFAALGAVEATLEHDDAAAGRAFRTALRLNADDLDALVWYGTSLMNAGHVAEARRLFLHAMSVDPAAPGPIASLAWADFLARDYGDAIALAQQLLRAHRLESLARLTLASAYVERRDYANALPNVAALEDRPDTRTQAVAMRSQIYTLAGRRRLGLTTLERLEAQTDPSALGPWDYLALAAAYARLGRDDVAFVWLDRVRTSERRQLARDPRFDPLRSDARFRDWLSS